MKLLCVGDLALGDHPKAVGHGIYSRYKTGIPDTKAGLLFPKGLNPDIIFGNLEYDLSQERLSESNIHDFQCRGITAYASFLMSAGFNVVNMANNHIYQYGEAAYDKTVSILNEKGIKVCGNMDDFTGKNIIIKGGKKVGFIGWSQRPRQQFTSQPLYNEFDEGKYVKEIRWLKERVDILIVSIHWGEEFIQIPSEFEERIGKEMIDSGANAVIGHHPHVLRRIEEYNHGLIAYSLGNFICDMSWEDRTTQSGALFLEVKDNKAVDWLFYPARIGEDYLPEYLSQSETESFFRNLYGVFKALNEDKVQYGYSAVAKRELKRHKAASLKYLIKNMYRYKRNILFQILFEAIKDRLKPQKTLTFRRGGKKN